MRPDGLKGVRRMIDGQPRRSARLSVPLGLPGRNLRRMSVGERAWNGLIGVRLNVALTCLTSP